jgi:hypothetical protein
VHGARKRCGPPSTSSLPPPTSASTTVSSAERRGALASPGCKVCTAASNACTPWSPQATTVQPEPSPSGAATWRRWITRMGRPAHAPAWPSTRRRCASIQGRESLRRLLTASCAACRTAARRARPAPVMRPSSAAIRTSSPDPPRRRCRVQALELGVAVQRPQRAIFRRLHHVHVLEVPGEEQRRVPV